jgi:hypothetical protein
MNIKINLSITLLLWNGLIHTAEASSGYKVIPQLESTSAIELRLDDSDIHCSEIDSWGQSDLTIQLPEISMPTGITVRAVSRLFDGRCNAEAEGLRTFARVGPIKATLFVKAYEYISWGIIDEGARWQNPYCKKELRQFVYLAGNSLFPQYEFQSSQNLDIEVLRYEDCVNL